MQIWKKIKDILKNIGFFLDDYVEEQLDVRYPIMSVLLWILIIICIPVIILTALQGNGFATVCPLVIAFGILCFSHWRLHIKKDVVHTGIIISVSFNFFILPWAFLMNGGSRSGMMIWLVVGFVFNGFLLSGYKRYVIIVLNMIVIVALFYIEIKYPMIIRTLKNDVVEKYDMVESVIMAGVIFSAILRYQAITFGKKNRELLKREKELTKANERLESANNAKNEFLANVSHEIRTPINAVLGMDEVILRESHENKTLECAQNIQSAGHSLLAIISDLLDVTKMESGMMQIIPAEYNLMDMLIDCYNVVVGRANGKGLPLYVENDINLPRSLVGDEVRVRQMIVNLLTNAVKYTTKGKVTLRVMATQIDDDNIELIIEVNDTGEGITAADQEKLFDNFVRIDEKRNRNIEGTGLGLSIVKKMCDLMNGSIEVESTYGVGSTFILKIPQKVADWKTCGSFESNYVVEEKTNEYHESFHAPNAKVLAVDDVEINLQVLEMMLSQTMLQIDMAGGGQEALDKLRASKYDLVLLDHMMPQIDGIEVLRRLRKMDTNVNQNIPVIALTANAVAGAREEYLRNGFDDYLEKPLNGELLEQILIKHLPKELVELM